MDSNSGSIERQVTFWSLLGPFFLLMATAVLILHASNLSALVYPPLVLLGLPLCWRFRIKGMAATLALFIAALAIRYPDITVQERFWEVGITLSYSLGIFVTAFSLEEVANLVQSLSLESKSRLENLLRLDEKLKRLRERLDQERQMLSQQVQSLEQAKEKQDSKVSGYLKLTAILKEELKQCRSREDQLLQELGGAQKQTIERVAPSQIAESDQTDRIEELENQISSLQSKLQEKEKALQSYITVADQTRKEEDHRQELTHEVNVRLETLSREKSLLEDSLKRVQKELQQKDSLERKLKEAEQEANKHIAQYRQMREQFDEKSKVLENTRKELFYLQEQQLAMEMEREEEQLYGRDEFSRGVEKYFCQLEREMQDDDKLTQSEIRALHSLIESLLASKE